jgi:hypothetical protein
MKRSSQSTLSILFAAFAVFLVLFGGSQAMEAGEGKYILVTLKDKSEVKFDYDAFLFNWVAPQIRGEITCKTHDFAKDEIVEIYVLNRTLNPCNQKEDEWVFDLYLKDKKPIQGFLELNAEEVTGKLYGADTERSIPFTDISKVSYH